MSIIETIALLGSFWLMIVLTMILAFVLIKDKTTEVKNVIKKISDNTSVNKVEVITDEMEADIEEGVRSEYYGRF